ncbi:ilvB operon leader peptide protein [Escherichia coli K-12]|nr:ilvB operon leader peptide protein [Escherichia coli K-12]ALJ96371.1 ilvB operon leader peptide protein [Escherichia coli K-12]
MRHPPQWSSCVWWWSSAMRRRDWNNTRFQNPAGANRAGFFV